MQLYTWLHPTALSCELDVVHPTKFKVDVTDETGETVAIATILTMVKNRDQPEASGEGRDA